MSEKKQQTILGTFFTQHLSEQPLMAEAILAGAECTPLSMKMARIAKINSEHFSFIVDLLKNPRAMPILAINELMALCWNVVGSRTVQFATGPFPTLGFSFQEMPSVKTPVIASPTDWFLRIKKDPFYQIGAVVNTASKVRDYWNGHYKLDYLQGIMMRAAAYEVEYLKWLTVTEHPDYQLDEYQRGIMEALPNGLNSLPNELIYTSKQPPKHPNK